MQSFISTTQKGFSLVEVLVAIAILLMSLMGPMTIATKGIQSANYVREQTTAIFLAQEGIEAFIAKRNDEAIISFASGNLATSWDWVTDTNKLPVACTSSAGCNIDFRITNPLTTAVSCSTPTNCDLYFDATKNQARYSLDTSGASTPYRRIIKVTPVLSGDGIQIESTVSWGTRLFGTQEQSVTLTTTLFSLYE